MNAPPMNAPPVNAPVPASATPLSAADAIRTRRAVRAFLPTPVPRETVVEILELAARAPSGSNIQPWQVLVVMGEPLKKLTAELHALALAGKAGPEEYQYYPLTWREPYLARRRKLGWDLYGAVGIARGENEKMAHQQARNQLFFDAPVGLFFTIDRELERGSWLDYGMFLQNIMIAARAFGLHTCPQGALNPYAAVIATRLAIPKDRMLVCAMALGHADLEAPVNHFVTQREPAQGFARFVETLA